MIKKDKLRENVKKAKCEAGSALQTLHDSLNQGQRKKVIKDRAVKALFDRYGVKY